MGLDGNLIEIDKQDPLERLLSRRIQYGPAQEKLSRSIYLLLFSEGCETIVLGLLLPELTVEWELGVLDKSFLITIVYLGVTLGSYIQTLSDQYGRYSFITWNAILQTVFGLLSCVCPTFNTFVVARLFYGIGIGICLPLSASYIAEISPAEMRGTLMSRSRVYWSSGALVTCVLSWYLLERHYWRTLLFIICLPGMYAVYEHHKNGRESLRYLWVKRDLKLTSELIDYMTDLNRRERIPHSQIQALMQVDTEKPVVKEGEFKDLLNQKYFKSTCILLLSWFSVCFMYYGVMLLLPTILTRNYSDSPNFKYLTMVFICLIEVISFSASQALMDHPRIGRKKCVYIGFILAVCATLMIVIFGEGNGFVLLLMFIVIKFVVAATFMVLYPYTAQIYQTMLRGKALGIMSVSGRVSTMILGIVGVSALEWMGGNGLYFLFVCLGAVSGWAAYNMPYCTLGRALDS